MSGGPIKSHKLANLKQYKYAGVDKSWLANNVLQPYWSRLVLLMPINLAPNTITLVGFMAIVANYATLLYYRITE